MPSPEDRRRVGSGREVPPNPILWLAAALKRWILTANAPVKVGVIVSLFGVAFLIREATVRGFISLSIEARLGGVAVFGVLLLAFGWRQRTLRPAYGLSLQGGGVAVLFLTTFAAYARYDVLPAVVALAVVVAITVGAGTLAVVQNSLSLALLGLVGGFLAPILAYRWPEDHLAVFSFYAVLNVAVIAVARLRSWPVLVLAGYAFTFVVTGLWLAARTAHDDWAQLQPFTAFFVLLYVAVPMAFPPKSSDAAGAPDIRDPWMMPLIFGTPFVGLGLQELLLGHTEHGLLVSSLVLAGVHVALHLTARRFEQPDRLLAVAYAALTMAFVAIAVPLAFDAVASSSIWAVQGTVLVWAGTRWRLAISAAGGALLQLLAAAMFGAYLIEESASDLVVGDPLRFWSDTTAVANPYFIGSVVLAASGLASAVLLRRRVEQGDFDIVTAWLALLWGLGWWLFATVTEVSLRLDEFLLWALLGVAMLTLGALVLAARPLRWPDLDGAGVFMLPVLALALVGALADKSHPAADYGWAAWLVSFAIYVAFLYACDERWPELTMGMHAGGYWIVSVLIGLEVNWQLTRVLEGFWPLAGALGAVLMWVFGTLGARSWLSWPVSKHWRTYLLSCATPVLVTLLLIVFALVVASDGNADPLLYIPLLNPVEMLGLASGLGLLWWRELMRTETRDAQEGIDVALGDLVRSSWAPAFGVAGVIGVTMTAARSVHHWDGVPFDASSLIQSTALQAALSILWAVIALMAMVAGVRLVRRSIWIAGGAWMAVVVVKLFLVDLANLTALSRIVSFIGVGLLLLVVGYFAPVPPADSEGDAEGPDSLSEEEAQAGDRTSRRQPGRRSG